MEAASLNYTFKDLSSEGRGDRAVVKEECGIKENLDHFFLGGSKYYIYICMLVP